MADQITKVFIAWDSELRSVGPTFLSIQQDPGVGLTIDILGAPGTIAYGQLDRRLAEGIGGSNALVAIIDTPNANVTWELGWAIARGLRVAVATEGGSGAPWVGGTPLSPMLQERGVGGGKRARSLLASVNLWPMLDRRPATGVRKLLVCPDHGCGEEWRRVLQRTLAGEGWEIFSETGWTLLDLPHRMDGVAQLAWIVLPSVKGEARHGVANTMAALVAGYADGLGITVGSFRCPESVEIADARHRQVSFDATPNGLVQSVRDWSTLLDLAPPLPNDPIVAWRRKVHALHEHPLRYVERLGLASTELVPVDLDVETGNPVDCIEPSLRHGEVQERARSGRLRTLIEEDLTFGRPPRWLVKADPGAGKTTLLRQLAHVLSAENSGATPVFVSLADWEQRKGDLLKAAVAQVKVDAESELSTAMALARLGQHHGHLWLFLDGFDEVRSHDSMRQRIQDLAHSPSFAKAVIVVTSRAGAVEQGKAWAGFTPAVLRYLDVPQQEELVCRLLDRDSDAASRFWRDMGERPGVAILLRNPFLLTLAVGLHTRAAGREEAAPIDRLALLGRALDDCLGRGWGLRMPDPERQERWSPRAARHILRALSLELHRKGSESWSRETLSDVLNGLPMRYPEVAKVFGHDGTIWKSDEVLLNDLQHHAGVLGPLDGDGLPWRYLHRSLREMLAAECLADEMTPEARKREVTSLLSAKAVYKDMRGLKEANNQSDDTAMDDGPGRAAGVLALLAGRLLEPVRDGLRVTDDPTEPMRVLNQLVSIAPDAALQVLPSVERLDAWDRLRLLLSLPRPRGERGRVVAWDNDQLDAVLDAIARGREGERLWAAVRPGLSTLHKGVLWYALERVETWNSLSGSRRWSPSDREAAVRRFFEACTPKPPTEEEKARYRRERGVQMPMATPLTPPSVESVLIGGGTAWIGAIEDSGYESEFPRHLVSISAFRLMRTPVTVSQFRLFDSGIQATGREQYPVTSVDWFTARLFAAWIGGRLPTEAEWEYACRANSETKWCIGDDPKKLKKYAWFGDNSGGVIHPIGKKTANDWGLHDMHGNVWEWCEDRHGSYSESAECDPAGAARGAFRALRGGAYWTHSGQCRSAFRGMDHPSLEGMDRGFRVVMPV